MGRLVPLIFTSLEPQEDGGDGRYLAFIHHPLALILKMTKNKKFILERISEVEAERIVDEDLARYHHLGEDEHSLLIFHETKNVYHRNHGEDYYIRIGSMQTQSKGVKNDTRGDSRHT